MNTSHISMSFDTDGSIEFTRNKALDQFFGGRGNMRRVTDIKKVSHGSLFYIQWLMGPFSKRNGPSHTLDDHIEVFGPDAVAWDCRVDDNTQTLMFFSYEIAVQYEIACLNRMRENGITFDDEKAAS